MEANSTADNSQFLINDSIHPQSNEAMFSSELLKYRDNEGDQTNIFNYHGAPRLEKLDDKNVLATESDEVLFCSIGLKPDHEALKDLDEKGLAGLKCELFMPTEEKIEDNFEVNRAQIHTLDLQRDESLRLCTAAASDEKQNETMIKADAFPYIPGLVEDKFNSMENLFLFDEGQKTDFFEFNKNSMVCSSLNYTSENHTSESNFDAAEQNSSEKESEHSFSPPEVDNLCDKIESTLPTDSIATEKDGALPKDVTGNLDTREDGVGSSDPGIPQLLAPITTDAPADNQSSYIVKESAPMLNEGNERLGLQLIESIPEIQQFSSILYASKSEEAQPEPCIHFSSSLQNGLTNPLPIYVPSIYSRGLNVLSCLDQISNHPTPLSISTTYPTRSWMSQSSISCLGSMVGDNPSQPIASICRRSSISNVAKSSASPVSYNCKKKAAYVIWRSKPYSLAWWAPLTGTGLPNCLEPPTEALSKLHQEFSRQANYEKRMAGLIAAASARAQAERSLRFSRIRQGARALRTMLRQQQNRLQVFE